MHYTVMIIDTIAKKKRHFTGEEAADKKKSTGAFLRIECSRKKSVCTLSCNSYSFGSGSLSSGFYSSKYLNIHKPKWRKTLSAQSSS